MSRLESDLNGGYDVIFHGSDAMAHWDALRALRAAHSAGYWMVIVPDADHELIAVARSHRDQLGLGKIVPEMADADRLKVVQAIRGHRVDMLFVTPDRLAQEKFIRFIAETDLALIVIAAAQRCLPEDSAPLAAYEVLSSLRDTLPELPVLALLDGVEDSAQIDGLTEYLQLSLPDEAPAMVEERVVLEKPAPPAVPARPPVEAQSPQIPPHLVAKWPEARPMFEGEASLTAIAEALGVDAAWCVEALIYFIRETGRTKPFPWVDQPTYLAVAVAAGQTESTDPRAVISVLGDKVAEDFVRVSLAALQNRAAMAPNRGAR